MSQTRPKKGKDQDGVDGRAFEAPELPLSVDEEAGADQQKRRTSDASDQEKIPNNGMFDELPKYKPSFTERFNNKVNEFQNNHPTISHVAEVGYGVVKSVSSGAAWTVAGNMALPIIPVVGPWFAGLSAMLRDTIITSGAMAATRWFVPQNDSYGQRHADVMRQRNYAHNVSAVARATTDVVTHNGVALGLSQAIRHGLNYAGYNVDYAAVDAATNLISSTAQAGSDVVRRPIAEGARRTTAWLSESASKCSARMFNSSAKKTSAAQPLLANLQEDADHDQSKGCWERTKQRFGRK